MFIVFLGLIVLLAIGAVAFVLMRNEARKNARAAIWAPFAEELGGTFQDDTIQASKDGYSLTINTAIVSVAQAMSSPYYPDGGTFTLATLAGDVKFSEVVAPTAVHNPDAFTSALPRASHLVIGANGATVVMHGSVIDTTDLKAAVAALETMHRKASSEGPFQVRG